MCFALPKKYLNPEAISIVAVGKPSDFGKPLTTLGPVKEIDSVSLNRVSLLAPPKTDSASLQRGKALLQKAQQAIGGAEKIAAVTDYTQQVAASINTPQGSMNAKQTNQWMRSGRCGKSQELPFGKIVAFYDGKTNWLASPQGTMEMPAPVLRQMQGEKMRSFFELMLSDRNPSLTVNPVADSTVEIFSQRGRQRPRGVRSVFRSSC